jgi:hypothetical protein
MVDILVVYFEAVVVVVPIHQNQAAAAEADFHIVQSLAVLVAVGIRMVGLDELLLSSWLVELLFQVSGLLLLCLTTVSNYC